MLTAQKLIEPAEPRTRIWDLPTRLLHWALAAATAVSLYTGLSSDGDMELHLTSGYVVLALLLFRLGRTLDALTLGEEAADTLGIDLIAARRLLVAGVALSVGAATAVTGIIGFVGLVVPHLLRGWVGHRPSFLLPASALGGAALLLLADALLRLVSPWIDIRIGVLTAILGAPFFVALVVRMRRELAP